MKTFQIVLLAVFGFLGLLGVLVFGGVIKLPGGPGGSGFGGEVTLWGTFPNTQLAPVIADINSAYSASFLVRYEEHSPDTFRNDLISALASGKGPDMILFPHDMLLGDRDKLFPVSYESLPERDFLDTFVDGADVYLSEGGAYALPVLVDPLVMYWNKEIVNAGGFAAPPRTWEEIPEFAEKITVRDDRGNITESAIALGGLKNIDHAKEILSTLFIQVGDKIVDYDRTKDEYKVAFGGTGSGAPEALRFYSEFGDAAKKSYSWNSSLPDSREAFENGSVGLYFGFASEYEGIKRRNPHLGFDVAQLPQREEAKARLAFGRYYALGVLRASKNSSTAYQSIFAFITDEFPGALSSAVRLPSALRVLLSGTSNDPVLDLFNRAAIATRAWVDPNPGETNSIFSDMVESVIIGRSTGSQAVAEARTRIDSLLR